MTIPPQVIAFLKENLKKVSNEFLMAITIILLINHIMNQHLYYDDIYDIKSETAVVKEEYVKDILNEVINIGITGSKELADKMIDSTFKANPELTQQQKRMVIDKYENDLREYRSALRYSVRVFTHQEIMEYLKINGYHVLKDDQLLMDNYLEERSKHLFMNSFIRINEQLSYDNFLKNNKDRFNEETSYILYRKVVMRTIKYDSDMIKKIEETKSSIFWFYRLIGKDKKG